MSGDPSAQHISSIPDVQELEGTGLLQFGRFGARSDCNTERERHISHTGMHCRCEMGAVTFVLPTHLEKRSAFAATKSHVTVDEVGHRAILQ